LSVLLLGLTAMEFTATGVTGAVVTGTVVLGVVGVVAVAPPLPPPQLTSAKIAKILAKMLAEVFIERLPCPKKEWKAVWLSLKKKANNLTNSP